MTKAVQTIVNHLKQLGPIMEVDPLHHALQSFVLKSGKKQYRIDLHDVSSVVYHKIGK